MCALHALDNPIYAALRTRQAHLAEVNGPARRFVPAISVLAGFEAPVREGYDALAALVPVGETTGIILDAAPEPMLGWSVLHDVPLLQMVCEAAHAEPPRHAFLELGAADAPEMQALTDLAKPGPFGPRTHEFGGYVGIRAGGHLAAMAGYRMRVPGFTEISAICTHPDHASQGYARSLTNALIARILAAGETPYLHVRAANDRAVPLYERMGFRTRYHGHYVIMRRV